MTDQNTIVDKAVSDAKSLPDLIGKLSAIDPALAQQFTGKALIASKTVYGVGATALVTWLVTKEGLGWDANTVDLVSGLMILAATAIFRKISSTPITGIFTKKAN